MKGTLDVTERQNVLVWGEGVRVTVCECVWRERQSVKVKDFDTWVVGLQEDSLSLSSVLHALCIL